MLGVDIFVSKLFCRAGMVVDLPAVWRYTGARGGMQSEGERTADDGTRIFDLRSFLPLILTIF